MHSDIIMVLAILAAVIVLLIIGRLPLEVLALLVLGVLATTGLVEPLEALSGFSNPAVVTIWALFILGGGLARTGIASILGRHLLKFAGKRESMLVVFIMTGAGVLSAFMNNIAVAALMLPVVMDIARKTGRPSGAYLIPLAYGSLLGGLTTMIGTPGNILVSETLRGNGLTPFALFDYTPVGLVVMISGIAFITLIGMRILPRAETVKRQAGGKKDFRSHYQLHENLFRIKIPTDSAVAGKSLAKSHLGSGFGLNVLSITRGDQTLLAPDITEIIQPKDEFIVEGRPERIQEMNHWRQMISESGTIGIEALFSQGMHVAEVQLSLNSSHVHETISNIGFRNRFGINVLAIRRSGQYMIEDLKFRQLQENDVLLVHGPAERIVTLETDDDFRSPKELPFSAVFDSSPLGDRLRWFRIPADAELVDLSLNESRLGNAVDVQILCIVRRNGQAMIPTSGVRFEPEDRLLISGDPEMVSMLLMGVDSIFIQDSDQSPNLAMLEDDHVGLIEVVLSPHSSLSGLTLGKMNFREKYGLTVLSIWRKGRAYRSGLRDMVLQFGDALLLYGRWDRLNVLGQEPDFLVLTETAQELPREEKAGTALAIMAAVLLVIILGWLPIYIAVVMGAACMVLTKCLTMEEAYRKIEWKVVFLIAGILPLATALERTGAAHMMADGVVGALGQFGPHAVLFGLLMFTFLATSIIPTAALVVLMAPVALKAAVGFGISPHALMMGVAMAASSSFISPISHPANVLVMGPGGYRFADYLKVGIPLTLVVLVVLMLILPVFWPLTP